MLKFINKVVASTFLGAILGLILTYQVPQAAAAVGAVFDTINRGYFVATGNRTMTIGTSGTGDFALVAAGTPVAKIDTSGIAFQSGFGPKLVPNTAPIFIATPVTGTNYVAPGFSVVPATATANTAAFVGVATPVAGTTFKVYNGSTTGVYLKAAGGATINGAQAGGRFVLATLCTVDCVYSSATNLVCTPPVCATPLAA